MSKIIKIVYFDELSAMDILNIENGGIQETTETDVTKKSKSSEGKLLTEIGIGKKLFGLAKAYGEISGAAGFSRASERTIEATISNTVLTDYLLMAEGDIITKLDDYRVYPDEKSMTYLKLFAPYLKFIETNDIPIRIENLGAILDEGKGYYELIGEKNQNPNDKAILRFNTKAFRNNYGLVDLSKMDLIFHAIKVGEGTLDSLNAENEFKIAGSIATIDDILENEMNEKCLIYDVILAGVKKDN